MTLIGIFCSSSNDDRKTERIKEQFYGDMRDIMNIYIYIYVKDSNFPRKDYWFFSKSWRCSWVIEKRNFRPWMLCFSLSINFLTKNVFHYFFYYHITSLCNAYHLLFLQGCYKCLFCLKISAKCMCTPEEKVIFHPVSLFSKFWTEQNIFLYFVC